MYFSLGEDEKEMSRAPTKTDVINSYSFLDLFFYINLFVINKITH